MAGVPVAKVWEMVDDHVLKICQVGPAKVKRHHVAVRRLAGGHPEVVNDQNIQQRNALLNPCVKHPSVLHPLRM